MELTVSLSEPGPLLLTATFGPPQTLWIKLGADGQWVQQTNARVTTDNSGRYSWSRNFGKDKDGTPIGVRFFIDGNVSNEVTLPRLRQADVGAMMSCSVLAGNVRDTPWVSVNRPRHRPSPGTSQ